MTDLQRLRTIVGIIVMHCWAMSTVGHEVTVHHRLTARAIELADRLQTFLEDMEIDQLKGFDGYTELPVLVKEAMSVGKCSWGFETYAGEVNGFSWNARDLLQAGSITEDQYGRGACHFYLPESDGHGRGTLFCSDAVTWALSPEGRRFDPQAPGLNRHKWSDAIDNMFMGLTGIGKGKSMLSRDERKEQVARAFYDLGHVIHLLQDMSQPGHVRGDKHAWRNEWHESCPWLLVTTSPLEKFFDQERKAVDRILDDSFGSGPAPPVLPCAKAYFRELAEWSAGNFFSEDTIAIMGELCHLQGYPPQLAGTCSYSYIPWDPEYNPTGVCTERATDSEVCLDTAWPTLFDYGCDRPSGPPELACPFVSNVGILSNPRVAYIAPWSWFENLTIDNRVVHEDAGKALFPKAVQYSAGLLNHFFRSRLRVTSMCVSPVPGGDDEVTYTVINESSLYMFQLNDLFDSLTVLAELSDGTLKEMTWRVYPNDLPPVSSSQEPPVATITAYYPDEDPLARADRKTVIVYRGNIGLEPGDVEEGISATIASVCETGETGCSEPRHSESGFVIAARKSDRGLRTINPFPSINDQGIVAFVGEDRLGSGAFIVDSPRRPRRVSFSNQNRTYSGAAINMREVPDVPQVATQEQCDPLSNCGDLPYYAIRAWGTHCSAPAFCHTLIGQSPTDFSSTVGTLVSNNVDINNQGVVTFPAVVGGITNLFAGSGGSPINLTPGVNLGNIRPSISDTNRIVIRNSQGRIFSYAYPPPSGGCPPNCPSRLVAGPTTGFTTLGLSPAFSSDGRVVVFAGVLSMNGAETWGLTPGAGVFAAVDRSNPTRWEIHRLAGVSGNSYLDAGETCVDRNKNQVCDLNPTAPASFDIDEGPISSFVLDDSLGVNDRGAVVFLALNNNDMESVFSNRLAFEGTPVYVGAPRVIVKVGDKLTADGGDELGQIHDLSIYKPISNLCPAQVVFWAGLGGTDSAIVVATVP